MTQSWQTLNDTAGMIGVNFDIADGEVRTRVGRPANVFVLRAYPGHHPGTEEEPQWPGVL
jgi:hypothetical protein